jgi:ribonucleotide monophosphatase NagD (HAD superfamily)
LHNISGLLIDLDGVVYISNQAIPGAADVINRLKSKNISLRFVTNTTTMSQDSLHKKMLSMGSPSKNTKSSAPSRRRFCIFGDWAVRRVTSC